MGLLVAASADDGAVKFNVPGVSNAAPQASTPAAAPATAPAKSKFTDAQIAEAYGWYTGMRMGRNQRGGSKAEVEAMGRGLVGAATGGQPAFDPKEIGPDLQAFLGKFSPQAWAEEIAETGYAFRRAGD